MARSPRILKTLIEAIEALQVDTFEREELMKAMAAIAAHRKHFLVPVWRQCVTAMTYAAIGVRLLWKLDPQLNRLLVADVVTEHFRSFQMQVLSAMFLNREWHLFVRAPEKPG